MSCAKHPNSGVVWLGEQEMCHGCWLSQYDCCPLCGYEWEDPRECKRGESKEKKVTDFYDINTRNRKPKDMPPNANERHICPKCNAGLLVFYGWECGECGKFVPWGMYHPCLPSPHWE